MKESFEVKQVEAEMIANRIRAIFKDVYGDKVTDEKDYRSPVLGVAVVILGEDGFEKYNSEMVEINRYYMWLLKELEVLDIYMRIASVRGTPFNGTNKDPIDLRGLRDLLEGRDKQ